MFLCEKVIRKKLILRKSIYKPFSTRWQFVSKLNSCIDILIVYHVVSISTIIVEVVIFCQSSGLCPCYSFFPRNPFSVGIFVPRTFRPTPAAFFTCLHFPSCFEKHVLVHSYYVSKQSLLISILLMIRVVFSLVVISSLLI